MTAHRPATRPGNPCFSSGPCAKRPGWSVSALSGAAVGRSHRAKLGKAKLAEVIERSKKILGLPADWRLGIVPASDTGAVELALWSLLGRRGVEQGRAGAGLLAFVGAMGAAWLRQIVRPHHPRVYLRHCLSYTDNGQLSRKLTG